MEVSKRKRSVIAFTDALCRLVGDTSIDQITVTALCSEAGYTSMAFYSNFENKHDFLFSIVDHEAQIFAVCVFNHLEEAERLSGVIKLRPEFYLRTVTDYLEYIAENRVLYQCVLNNQFIRDGIGLLSKRMTHHMRPYLSLQTEKHPEPDNFTSFFLEITVAQMLMVVRYWLGKMPGLEPHAVAELYCERFLFRDVSRIQRDPQSGIFCATV